MRFKSTGILLVVFAALLAYVYFFEIKGKEKAEKAKERESKLLVFEKDSLKSIYLKKSGIKLEKENDRWMITEPVRSKTENWVVNSLINSIADAKKERRISSDPASYSEYGLDPARHEIIIAHNGKQDTLYLGEKSPTGSYVFVRVNSDSQVYATGTLLLTNAEKDLFDFRDKTVLSFETSNAEKLKIKSSKRTIEARKEGDDWYLYNNARKILADDIKINQILNGIRNAKAKKFVEEKPVNLDKYGLTNPLYEVEINVSGDGGLHALAIGKQEDGTYFARDVSRDPIFTIDTSVVRKLDVTLWDLREKKLADFYSYQVDYLELRVQDSTFVFEKDTAGVWQVTAPVQGKAKSWKISSLTGSASALKAEKIVAEKTEYLKKYGLDNPSIQIICKKEGEEIANIKIGRKVGDHYYAMGNLSPAVVLVKQDDVKKFNIQLQDILEEEKEVETEQGQE